MNSHRRPAPLMADLKTCSFRIGLDLHRARLFEECRWALPSVHINEQKAFVCECIPSPTHQT
eukprot:c36918_g1_i1 orf=130-315(+)